MYSANFKYLGAVRYFTITLKNTGSIAAVLDQVIIKKNEVCVDENDDVAENCYDFRDELNTLEKNKVTFVRPNGSIVAPGEDGTE